jgi:hypothetical protein
LSLVVVVSVVFLFLDVLRSSTELASKRLKYESDTLQVFRLVVRVVDVDIMLCDSVIVLVKLYANTLLRKSRVRVRATGNQSESKGFCVLLLGLSV